MTIPRTVDPLSLRGRIVISVHSVIRQARDKGEHYMRTEAAKQRLNADQLLAAVITEAVLKEIDRDPA